jgi:hypothetical protein
MVVADVMWPFRVHGPGLALALIPVTMTRMHEDHSSVIQVLQSMQERLRTLRFRLCSEANKEHVRYHAFSGAVAQLNRVIADLQKETPARSAGR